MIKYLDLKCINDQHDAELREAVNNVLDSSLRRIMRSTLAPNTASAVVTDSMR